MTPENPAGLREVTLDDPRLPDLRSRIHAARGHDWQPPCGSCLDWAFDYLRAADALAADEPGLGKGLEKVIARLDREAAKQLNDWRDLSAGEMAELLAARLREEGDG